jgi:hypothetical protein
MPLDSFRLSNADTLEFKSNSRQNRPGLDAAPRSPKPQVAGSIPVPPAPLNQEMKRLLADELGAARLLIRGFGYKTPYFRSKLGTWYWSERPDLFT